MRKEKEKSNDLYSLAIPPGETIKELMEDRQMNKEEFEKISGITEDQADSLLDGSLHINPALALHLEVAFGIPSDFWLRLEDIYRKDLEAESRKEN